MEINTSRTGKILHIGQLLPEQLQVPVLYDDVELTEEEKSKAIDTALKDARKRKHYDLEVQRKRRLSEEKMKDYKRPFTPNELYSLARWRATQVIRARTGDETKVFEPASFQKDVITALSLYFSDSPEFEGLDTKKYNGYNYPFKLNKGIWMWGNPGVGKSLMMEMFNRNRRICYDLLECPKLVYRYIKNGDEAIGSLIAEVKVDAPDAANFFQTKKGICFNDLGTESATANHYGNSINVLEYILLQSYENKIPYWQRHVTTNLTFDQVKEIYGVRLVDRIKECFNVIEVKGESLRH